MKTKFYLIVNSRGSVRVNKTAPRLDFNEVSIFLQVDLPNELFTKPSLQATIEIPQDVVLKTPITANVIDNVQDAIKSVTGLQMKVSVVEDKPQE